MRSRITRAYRDCVVMTLDGPMAISKDEVVIVAVVSDLDQAQRILRSIDTIDLPHPPKSRPRPTNANVIPRGKR